MRQEFYLATYTTKGGSGIGRGLIEPATGRPVVDTWTSAVPDPSWLALAPSPSPAGEPTLYAISELSPDGLISAFRIQDDGGLALLASRPTGAKPAHVVVHPNRRFLITSMYDGGSIAVHPIEDAGSVGLSCDSRLLGVPAGHAHQVVVDPSGDYLLAVDLGLDTVVSYRLDTGSGRLTELRRTRLRPGSGPRHLVFHPKGEHAYLVNEVDSTVTVCRWADGVLTPIDTRSTLMSDDPAVSGEPAGGGEPNYPGEIVVAADGRYLYVSNRGHNSIAVFAIQDDGATIELLCTPSCGGDWPRHLALDRTGSRLYVANERSGDVTWFPVDPASGLLGDALGRLAVTGVAQLLVV